MAWTLPRAPIKQLRSCRWPRYCIRPLATTAQTERINGRLFASALGCMTPTAIRSRSQVDVDRESDRVQSKKRRLCEIMAIQLNGVENQLARLLLAVGKHIEETDGTSEVVLRFTGGWVRDKILGNGGIDIDVAINNMTGYQFGLRLQQFLSLPGMESQFGLSAGSTLHKIEANPDKSKHLETTTTRIFGIDVDLVNLRKETYTEDSRNPLMEFGTAHEDALRRDATVNALFYNLQTREIEDLTGRGLQDMKDRIIRTPLQPVQTLKDDPLRVLRLIRFASRLSFDIDPDCFSCMGDADIKASLYRKISRERVGTEVSKMLAGPDPRRALELIDRAGLYDCIFAPLTISTRDTPEMGEWKTVYDFCHRLTEATDGPLAKIRSLVATTDEDRANLWTLCALVPWSRAGPVPASKNGKPRPPVATFALSDGIKAANKVSEMATAAVKNAPDIWQVKETCYVAALGQSRDSQPPSRESVGQAIRRWGPSWPSQMGYSILVDIFNADRSEKTIVDAYASFIQTVSTYKLEQACDLKRLINGGVLATAFQTKPGPWMKDILEVVVGWQLRHPDFTDEKGLIESLKSTPGPSTGGSDGAETPADELVSDLIVYVLSHPIKAVFNSSHPNLSSRGTVKTAPTVAVGRNPGAFTLDESDSIESPRWKKTEIKGKPGSSVEMAMLRWAISQLSPTRAAANWSLLIPPVLTLVEDVEPEYKTIGCRLLNSILSQTTPQLLTRTGLAGLFEQNLSSCLSHLPSLTPIPQSEQLLASAYPALLTLSDVLAGTGSTSPTTSNSNQTRLSDQILSSLLVSPALTHLESPIPTITTSALNASAAAVTRLGIDVVPHLGRVLSVSQKLASDPFAVVSPNTMSAAVSVIESCILASPVRIVKWKNGIVHALVAGWLNSGAKSTQRPESSEELDRVRSKIVDTLKLLLRAIKQSNDGSSIPSRLSDKEVLDQLVGQDKATKQLVDLVLSGDDSCEK